jgi:hypothetical protein
LEREKHNLEQTRKPIRHSEPPQEVSDSQKREEEEKCLKEVRLMLK